MKAKTLLNRKFHSKAIFAVIAIIALALTSCSQDFSAVSKLYIKNNVNKNLMILVDYSGGTENNAVISQISPYEGSKLVDNFQDANYNRFCSKNTNRKIYIYNVTDSTYYELNSSDFVSEPSPDFISTDNTQEVDGTSQTITYNYYVNVNESLLAKMQKNTSVTNPLFKIK